MLKFCLCSVLVVIFFLHHHTTILLSAHFMVTIITQPPPQKNVQVEKTKKYHGVPLFLGALGITAGGYLDEWIYTKGLFSLSLSFPSLSLFPLSFPSLSLLWTPTEKNIFCVWYWEGKKAKTKGGQIIKEQRWFCLFVCFVLLHISARIVVQEWKSCCYCCCWPFKWSHPKTSENKIIFLQFFFAKIC